MSSKPVHIPHELIRDSAGAGKTFKLTNRFIRLLYHGQAPERIIALTFTRKAAGEFFSGILTKLAKAAADPKAASELGRFIQVPEAKPEEFRATLRRLINGMGQLSLGTLDSFFHRMLAMFPMEFGLGSGFAMMSEFEKQQARLQALESLMSSGGTRKPEQESLVRSFQLATAGQDSRNFVGAFQQHLEDCHDLLLRAPRSSQWGDAAEIWPGGFPWPETAAELVGLVDNWRDQITDDQGFSSEIMETLRGNVEHFTQWAPGKSIVPRSKSTLIQRALQGFSDLLAGHWEFVFRKKTYSPNGAFCQALAAIIQHCVAREMSGKLARTQGIFGLITAFESEYDQRVRRQGRLTFADLPALLAPGNGPGLLGDTGPETMDLEYRLDGTFDHWLLDEFQDTSQSQWQVIAGLIDEVVQDPSGERTFFCIGDQKQSIYQWRGGDPRLLDHVADQYQGGLTEPPPVQKAKTYRCCPEIVRLLNQVFGDAGILEPFDDAKTGAQRWSRIWQTHESKNADPGQAQYLTVANEAERWHVMAQLLTQIRPIENRLKCAILVQTNKAVRTVVEFLRGAMPGLPVVGDSVNRPGSDNPLSAALLSLFRAAAHPADQFSHQHVLLTPLGKLLPTGESDRSGAFRRLQRDVHQHGFEATAREWIQRLDVQLDEFSQCRAQQFLELARQFDESGSRCIDEFLRYIPAQEHTEPAAEDVVQVMTIHKAKGLTFDVTLVPDLEGNRLDEPRRDALHVHNSAAGNLEWILDLPRQEICDLDPTLGKALAAARSEACYENLCKLYVALTRARQGLYIITTQPKPRSTSQNFIRLLHDTLAEEEGRPMDNSPVAATEVYCAGERDWISEQTTVAKSSLPPAVKVQSPRTSPRLARRKPSEHEGALRNGAQLFESYGTDAANFGTAVHEVFEQIEWVDAHTPALLEKLQVKFPSAVEEVQHCLAAPEIAALFEPDPKATVWCERKFELVLDGEFCSGVIDRAVIQERSAMIIDFKTDRVDDESIEGATAHHQPQLALYRRVLSLLTNLPEKAITCHLVFTRPARVMET